jgi:hypothetical protein
MAVTMKNAVFWDVTPYGCYKNQLFRGAYSFHNQAEETQQARNFSSN